MGQSDQYEIYLRRSMECEALAVSAGDAGVRETCANLAITYRALADSMRDASRSGLVEAKVQPFKEVDAGTADRCSCPD